MTTCVAATDSASATQAGSAFGIGLLLVFSRSAAEGILDREPFASRG